MSFRLCSYNMGAGAGDYHLLCRHLNPTLILDTKELQDKFDQDYDNAQKHVADRLKDSAEVFFLQEVFKKDRPLLMALQQQRFQFIHKSTKQPDGLPDCVLALSSDFQNIENQSAAFQGYDAAIASATHMPTGQRFTFVSAHAAGFDLDTIFPKSADDGDNYCNEIAAKVDQATAIPVFAGDINCSPEKWKARFSPFLDRGFQLFRSNAPTNVFPKSEHYKERELDFFLAKIPKVQTGLLSFFSSSKKVEMTMLLEDTRLSWTPQTNSLDHLPIFSRITVSQG